MQEIEAIVRDVARTHFPAAKIRRVMVEPGYSSTEEDTVRILMVVEEPVPYSQFGDGILFALSEIWTRLNEIGEERTPILRYASEDELETLVRQENGDSES